MNSLIKIIAYLCVSICEAIHDSDFEDESMSSESMDSSEYYLNTLEEALSRNTAEILATLINEEYMVAQISLWIRQKFHDFFVILIFTGILSAWALVYYSNCYYGIIK
ncbi:putative SP-containing membrane protein [Vairimorpha necatrix]|uniref:SP-containing membrane protein n=1 Tax=Vairimorpha necatrix TaxID=6039 RepID=A0AAX4JEY2_9MICR